MTNHRSGVTIDCVDPVRMSTCWGRLLAIEPSHEHGSAPESATLDLDQVRHLDMLDPDNHEYYERPTGRG
ncbi:hypothetical protein [Mycolicibacterium sp.]|uniref:hypothetical protein n=1 Tax=Mycolicibacterium sp. TaxID=2320850 RepID=UPI003D0CB1E9